MSSSSAEALLLADLAMPPGKEGEPRCHAYLPVPRRVSGKFTLPEHLPFDFEMVGGAGEELKVVRTSPVDREWWQPCHASLRRRPPNHPWPLPQSVHGEGGRCIRCWSLIVTWGKVEVTRALLQFEAERTPTPVLDILSRSPDPRTRSLAHLALKLRS